MKKKTLKQLSKKIKPLRKVDTEKIKGGADIIVITDTSIS